MLDPCSPSPWLTAASPETALFEKDSSVPTAIYNAIKQEIYFSNIGLAHVGGQV